MRKNEQPLQPTGNVPVVCADPNLGLHSGQVRERERAGYMNTPINPPTKSVGQIILSNVFTYFNIVFFILAAAIIFVGSWRNLTFMLIVIANTAIGIVQELRSKKTLDNLKILSAPKTTVIRNGEPFTIDTVRTVRDDIVVFQNGNQIFADAVVVEGSCKPPLLLELNTGISTSPSSSKSIIGMTPVLASDSLTAALRICQMELSSENLTSVFCGCTFTSTLSASTVR